MKMGRLNRYDDGAKKRASRGESGLALSILSGRDAGI
jgi:hypothetical protein